VSAPQPHSGSTEGLKQRKTFVSPSGREWTVGILELPLGVGVRMANGTISTSSILRFVSGDVTLDLAEIPSDWASYSGHELVRLLRMAVAPAFVQLVTGKSERSIRDPRSAEQPSQ
jgi:hypothetical protein